MSWKCNIAGCIAERCEFSEIIVNAEDYRNLREREQRMYTDFSKSRDRIAQLEAAMGEVSRHLAGYPHFVTVEGLTRNIIAPAWKAARDAQTASETAAYCAPCEDGECAVHPSTMNRDCGK